MDSVQEFLEAAVYRKYVCDGVVFVYSGVITNSGGKVIVRKMAGQNIYKGSNSHGLRSLSLPKWRESFVVSGNQSIKQSILAWLTRLP